MSLNPLAPTSCEGHTSQNTRARASTQEARPSSSARPDTQHHTGNWGRRHRSLDLPSEYHSAPSWTSPSAAETSLQRRMSISERAMHVIPDIIVSSPPESPGPLRREWTRHASLGRTGETSFFLPKPSLSTGPSSTDSARSSVFSNSDLSNTLSLPDLPSISSFTFPDLPGEDEETRVRRVTTDSLQIRWLDQKRATPIQIYNHMRNFFITIPQPRNIHIEDIRTSNDENALIVQGTKNGLACCCTGQQARKRTYTLDLIRLYNQMAPQWEKVDGSRHLINDAYAPNARATPSHASSEANISAFSFSIEDN